MLVNTAAELASALKAAMPGSVIRLAPGSYENITLKDLNFSSAVFIESADFSNRAILKDQLSVQNCKNIVIREIDFKDDVYRDGSRPFVDVSNSQGIVLSHARIAATKAGDDARPAELVDTKEEKSEPIQGFAKRDGIIIKNSSEIELSNLDISSVRKAIRVAGIEDIKISNNHIHGFREDALHMGAVKNVIISDNLIENPNPFRSATNPKINDHPDMIAISSGRLDQGVQDVSIERNVFRTSEGISTQGITIANRGVSNADVKYENIYISDNIINTMSRNSLVIKDISNVVIENNAVLPAPRFDENIIYPRIIIETDFGAVAGIAKPMESVVIRNNITSQEWSDTAASYNIDVEKMNENGIHEYNNIIIRSDGNYSERTWIERTISEFNTKLIYGHVESMEDISIDTSEFSPHFSFGPRVPLIALHFNDASMRTEEDNIITQQDVYAKNGIINGSEIDDKISISNANGGVVFARSGNDRVDDSIGDDAIFGGAGNDRLYSSNGTDYLSGGTGADKFFINMRTNGERTVIIEDLNFSEGDQLIFHSASGEYFDFLRGLKDVEVSGNGRLATILGIEGFQKIVEGNNVHKIYYEYDDLPVGFEITDGDSTLNILFFDEVV